MENSWVFKPEAEDMVVKQLAESLKVSQTLAALLAQRGIGSFDVARDFFRPKLDHLHDPFLMKDMDLAVSRLQRAIKEEEKILIYGDYDVDGTTSVAMVYGFLSKFYSHLAHYVPDRYKEGYGISKQGIDYAVDEGFSLVISLDCGIKGGKLIAEAKAEGVDFIVCDHHTPGEELPPAFAVLDPKRPDCNYPYKELSGCGVGFKLMQGFCLKQNIAMEELYPFMDLLAVSIASDIVHITGENRTMAFFGLKQLNENPRPGLTALIAMANYKGPINVMSVVFGLAPRINAAGRMAHASGAINLLLAKSEEEADALAGAIDLKNSTRKDTDSAITLEALEMIANDPESAKSSSTVLFKSDWHKGVIGIVASRCIETYYRPTIILTESKGQATGSARSVHGFDLYEAISACSEHLIQFGGHKYAAGLTLSVNKVDEFRKAFDQVVAERILPEQRIPKFDIDLCLPFDEINFKFFRIIDQMQPFGPQNMQPLFCSRNLFLKQPLRLMKELHAKLVVFQEGCPQSFVALAFNRPELAEMLQPGVIFDMLYTLEVNEFRGEKSLQLMVKDIKLQ